RAIQGNEVVIPLYRPVETVELLVGTGEPQSGEFEVFPNPTTDLVFVQHPEDLPIEKISVLEMTGKQAFEMIGPANQFDISGLPAGVYILKIETKNGLFIERLVKF